jgi:hypothetical protein
VEFDGYILYVDKLQFLFSFIRPYAMRLLNLVSTPKIFCNEVVEYMLEEREDE